MITVMIILVILNDLQNYYGGLGLWCLMPSATIFQLFIEEKTPQKTHFLCN
jgi:hypothetical protein